MPRIRYKASLVGEYHGATGRWNPGDEKDVSDEQSAHLLGPLGSWFELVAPPAVAPSINGVRVKPASGRVKA